MKCKHVWAWKGQMLGLRVAPVCCLQGPQAQEGEVMGRNQDSIWIIGWAVKGFLICLVLWVIFG